MPPRKGGVSRKVRIAGPYTWPEGSRGDSPSTKEPLAPSTSNLPLPTQLLSLTQVASARETVQTKYLTQLQSMYTFIFNGFIAY